MKADRSLRKILEDLSISLSEDGERRNIDFREDDTMGAISPDGEITVNPDPLSCLKLEDYDLSDKQVFSLLVNTESHEIEHDHVSNLNAKEELAEKHDNCPRLAGFIWNVVEDVYIDKRRTDRDRGLRPILALQSELIHESHEPITEREGIEKYSAAVIQIGKAGGTPVGFHNVEDQNFKKYCAEVRKVIDKVEDADTQKEREEITDEIVDLIEEYYGLYDIPDDMELPSDIPMAIPEEEMDQDGDPLPDANEDNLEPDDIDLDDIDLDDLDSDGGEGEQMDIDPDDLPEGMDLGDSEGESGSSNKKEHKCPNCDSNNIDTKPEIVDGMVAARCNTPFSVNSSWIENIEFIKDNKVCGFRIQHNGNLPKDSIESSGYLVKTVSSNIAEVLELKDEYDNKEEIDMNECQDCGNEWLPSFDN